MYIYREYKLEYIRLMELMKNLGTVKSIRKLPYEAAYSLRFSRPKYGK